MPINDLAVEYGLFTAEDLKFVSSIFNEVQQTHKLTEPVQSTALARQILYIYQTGERDRDALLTTVSGNYRKPRLVRFKRQRL